MNRAQLLIVEDDLILQALYRLKIARHPLLENCDVMTVGTYTDALATICKFTSAGYPNLILLDLNLGSIETGWDLMESECLQSLPEKTKVIICTSSTAYEDKCKALNYPRIIGFFEKPLSDVMFEEIAQILCN